MTLSGLFILFLLVMALGGAGAAYFLYERARRLAQENDEIRANLDSQDRTLGAYKKRFAPVLDLEAEVRRVQQVLNERQQQAKEAGDCLSATRAELTTLSQELAAVQESAELAEVGFYQPHFDFDASEKFKQEIARVRDLQKLMIKEGVAVKANTAWTMSGSKTEGQKMMKKLVQLTTRSFNNECESCVANVTWANIDKMEARLRKAHADINKFNEIYDVVISERYLGLKLDELRLTHEFRLKKQEEKEEQAEIRRQMREEEKAEREALAAAAKAEKEEKLYQSLLDKARVDAEAAAQALAASHAEKDRAELDRLQAELLALEEKLAEAHAQNVRAMSMAQQTKTGHVYVISNVGSFGENVYKIGMTRRLDPQERVDELGDASVPFCFDVHAMIYSTNAPDLEARLHRAFDARRINQVNRRKEFFRVSLDEIQAEVSKVAPEAEFTTTAVAEEFRLSQAKVDGLAAVEAQGV